jgi:hypothetical protein
MGEIDAYFKRTFAVSGSAVEKVWFRAAVGEITEKGDSFLLNEKIVLKFPGSHPQLRGPDHNKELLVPVTFAGGAPSNAAGHKATLVEEIIW